MLLSEICEKSGMKMSVKNDIEITGITADSRQVKPGFLFAALPGLSLDGLDFVDSAANEGATAVLVPEGKQLDSALNSNKANNVQLISDANPRKRFALIAASFYDRQPEKIAAVTGTNGKSSVVEFTRQIWNILHFKAASIGTLGIRSDEIRKSTNLTTPDPVKLHLALSKLTAEGVSHLALEASSHGLEQYRLDGVQVDVGAFTNLTRDHLDYHHSMGAYFSAKKRLFGEILSSDGIAVLNADVPHFEELSKICKTRGIEVLSYGRSGNYIRLSKTQPNEDGNVINIAVSGNPYELPLPLVGEFQVSNALCALGICLATGAETTRAVDSLRTIGGVSGRLELVGQRLNGGRVYVDYAHTPDGLNSVLKTLKNHTTGRLAVVFGCGGDRDPGKRREMGRIAEELADSIYITDDNPRHEDPSLIRANILEGAPNGVEIDDRAEAIRAAISATEANDVLLIAGKGHESSQIIGDSRKSFSDVETAHVALESERGNV